MIIVHKFTLVKKYKPKEKKIGMLVSYKKNTLTPRFLHFETDDFETRSMMEYMDYRCGYHIVEGEMEEIKI